jgi:acid phosphatase type 7
LITSAYSLCSALLCSCSMSQPQPSYSAFREASFGHAILDIKNRTHAHYAWHRNQDGSAVAADSVWFTNRYWHPTDDSADR